MRGENIAGLPTAHSQTTNDRSHLTLNLSPHSGNGEATSKTLSRTCIVTALIAGLFCILICAAMIFFYANSKADDPLKAPHIAALKEQLRATPQNEQLKQQIRALDLQVRRRYFYQLSLTTTGGYLALGGLIAFLLAVKKDAALRRKLPSPHPKADSDEVAVRTANWTRWSVAATGGLFALVLVALVLSTATSLPSRVSDLDKFTGAGSFSANTGAADFASAEEMAKNWTRFLGPNGNGFAPNSKGSVDWDAKTGLDILWKVTLPAPGFSSPILWRERVFLTGGNKTKCEVFCFNAKNGEAVWQRAVHVPAASPGDSWDVSEGAGMAASTMATDGRRVYAMFANADLAAFALDGTPVWSTNLGLPKNPYGHASSLATSQGRLIVQLDQGETEERKSKLYAFNSATGAILWQRQRPVPNSWATPLVVTAAGQSQIVTLGVPWVISYSATDGTELWRVEALGGEVTPSPIFASGLVFVASPNEKLLTIRPDGQGDVTKSHVTWSSEENVPDITSPASNGELIFTLSTSGVLTCYEAKNGKKQWEHDFKMEFHASPTIVGNRLYLAGLKGTVVVVEAGRQFKEFGRTELGEKLLATPAVTAKRMFIRGNANLYCIGTANEQFAKQ